VTCVSVLASPSPPPSPCRPRSPRRPSCGRRSRPTS